MKSNNFARRPMVAALISALVLQGCVTQNQKGEKLSVKDSIKETFASDDPCSTSKRNVGIAAGAVIGAIIGNLAGGKNKTLGTVIGATAGGALGGFIGAEMGNRACELHKIQQKYALDMQVTPIAVNTNANSSTSNGNDNQNATTAKTEQVGMSVSITDREGKPEFLSGSDQLQPESKEHFREIAKQYSIEQLVTDAGVKSPEDKAKLTEELRKKRVLLIGHTDDIGDSKFNADLSERRAKSVANIFKFVGVAEDQLYYQGAGETLPVADNSTPIGRAKNRRVEIVDLSDEATFNLYLQNRRPNTAYYRPVDVANKPAQPTTKIQTTSAPEVKPTSNKPASKGNNATKVIATIKTQTTKAARASQTSVRKTESTEFDFGGTPFTATNATVNIGEIKKNDSGFNLISEAHADSGPILSCNLDRPRNAGEVKSLKDGQTYATNKHFPGLYGRSWYENVNGNLVMLNNVKVLRDGTVPANTPTLKVYTNYSNEKQKPDVIMTPIVNTYQGSNGLLYRLFTNGEHGMQCIDILMPEHDSSIAKAGKVIYLVKGDEFVADFKPKIVP